MPYPELISEYPQSTQIFIKKVHNRIESGKNALIVVVGQTGSGKSLASIQLMRGLYLYRCGKEPDGDLLIDHISFKAHKFMQVMKDVSTKLKEDKSKIKRGDIWLWDEVGVDAGHKESMTVKNRTLGWLTQTFRNLQQVIFFTTPSISFIDASIRKLLHYYVEALYVEKKMKVCVMKPLEMQYNVRQDKIYYHNLLYPTKEGTIEVDRMGVQKISDELEDKYEEKKNEFTDDLNQQILDKLNEIEDSKHRTFMRREHREIYVLYHLGVTVQKKIAEILGKSPKTISAVCKTMLKKYPDWQYEADLLGNPTNLPNLARKMGFRLDLGTTNHNLVTINKSNV